MKFHNLLGTIVLLIILTPFKTTIKMVPAKKTFLRGGHLKIGSHMVFWSLAVFVTSTIHAILPFALEASSMNAAKKLASLVDTTFEHHK